jgi:hypothetical protein
MRVLILQLTVHFPWADSSALGIGLALTKLAASRGAQIVVGGLKLTSEGESFASSHRS